MREENSTDEVREHVKVTLAKPMTKNISGQTHTFYRLLSVTAYLQMISAWLVPGFKFQKNPKKISFLYTFKQVIINTSESWCINVFIFHLLQKSVLTVQHAYEPCVYVETVTRLK